MPQKKQINVFCNILEFMPKQRKLKVVMHLSFIYCAQYTVVAISTALVAQCWLLALCVWHPVLHAAVSVTFGTKFAAHLASDQKSTNQLGDCLLGVGH